MDKNINYRENYLAVCLLEALSDENKRNAESLLFKYNADPYLIIIDRKYAPIHYAAGMENADLGEAVLKSMLQRTGNINVITEEGETALHIAASSGRENIVKLLLDHNADCEIRDIDNRTPILCAIHERNYHLIRIFKNHIFLRKWEHKRQNINYPTTSNQSPTKKSKQILTVENGTGDELKYTPNRINYNYDVTSPYYINITHRRSANKPKLVFSNIQPPDDSNERIPCTKSNETTDNLFELNEENLIRYSKEMDNCGSRRSYIGRWREKLNSRPIDFDELNERLTSINSFISDLNNSDATQPLTSTHIHLPESTMESNFIKSPKPDKFIFQMTEKYVHTDDENGICFYEKKILPNPLIKTSDLEQSVSTSINIPLYYDTDELRAELTQFGERPGPITKNTKRLYIKRLEKYKRKPEMIPDHMLSDKDPGFSVELALTMNDDVKWINYLESYYQHESVIISYFQTVNAIKFQLREGHLKKSFIYLLIDPRISENLPGESVLLSKQETWKRFLSSIFYVGKGTSSRPYQHLYDAIKLYQNRTESQPLNASNPIEIPTAPENSKKLRRIIDIWSSDMGVVCLHVFHSIMPAEAYTREASIIDALGMKHLTNLKRGNYYGVANSWPLRQRKQLGVTLLYKAMQIFIAEGESQLRPTDIK